ncbi:hypothetical protein FHG87_008555, partial [Trinorchestia longiramus]
MTSYISSAGGQSTYPSPGALRIPTSTYVPGSSALDAGRLGGTSVPYDAASSIYGTSPTYGGPYGTSPTYGASVYGSSPTYTGGGPYKTSAYTVPSSTYSPGGLYGSTAYNTGGYAVPSAYSSSGYGSSGGYSSRTDYSAQS